METEMNKPMNAYAVALETHHFIEAMIDCFTEQTDLLRIIRREKQVSWSLGFADRLKNGTTPLNEQDVKPEHYETIVKMINEATVFIKIMDILEKEKQTSYQLGYSNGG
jgi:hypothetical protein